MPTDLYPATFCRTLSRQLACCINIMIKLPVNHDKEVHVSAQSCKLSAQWEAQGSRGWGSRTGNVWVADTWVCPAKINYKLQTSHSIFHMYFKGECPGGINCYHGRHEFHQSCDILITNQPQTIAIYYINQPYTDFCIVNSIICNYY